MKKLFLILCGLGLMIVSFRAGQHFEDSSRFLKHIDVSGGSVSNDEAAAITQTLTMQSAAWNQGDIDAFMQDYWQTDDLRFASGGTVKYGWQTARDRYKARYPDKAAMGTLAFTDLDVELLSASDALVFGRWTLTRQADAPTGLFTLHMRKQNGHWKIVSDHTSSAD